MKIQSLANLVERIPPEIIDLLGPPPVLSTENGKLYYAVFACFVDDINPADIFAWMMVKDLADYRWEILRYRRIKAALIQKTCDDFISKGLRGIETDYDTCRTVLAAKYVGENKALEKEFADKPEELKKRKLKIADKYQADLTAAEKKYKRDLADWEAVRSNDRLVPLALDSWIYDVQKVDKLAKVAERRFYDTLIAVERHLGGFGETLRERGEKIIEGEIVGRTDAGMETASSDTAQVRKNAG
jgi:hypothetical protein